MTIRRLPDDFVVEEVTRPGVLESLAPAPVAGRGFAVYRLTKVSLTTEEAVRRLGAALGVKTGHVEAAGLKDKHARTTQLVSARVEAGRAVGVSGEGWSAAMLGWSERGAEAGWIRRNRFRIVVRDLTAGACARMDERAAALADGARGLLLVNYFGDQRFGSVRRVGGGFVARHLVRGEFEEALRLAIGTPARKDTGRMREFVRLVASRWGEWGEVLRRAPACAERRAVEVLAGGGGWREAFVALPHFFQQMCVEAYQSHLWNATVRALAEKVGGGVGVVVAEDPFGAMVFPSPSRVGMGARGIEAPMPAPTTRLAEPWGGALAAVLEGEGVTLAGLKIPGVRRPVFGEAWRPVFVNAEGFAMGEPVADELGRAGRLKREVGFELARGAYATVVLRALGE